METRFCYGYHVSGILPDTMSEYPIFSGILPDTHTRIPGKIECLI
jgi:hypothetical protein